MSLLSTLFKSKKVNLTPAITPQSPEQINPQMYGDLTGLARRYMQGPGFGQDYLDKTVNPVADSMRRNFRNVTSPFLSSQYSARGLGRSNLAANAQGLAEGNVESDIGNLMAQFYQLNESQKKSDIQFGSNLGQNILSGDISAQQQQAAAAERLANVTAADARGREAADRVLAGNILQSGAQLAVPALGGMSSILGGIPGMGGLSSLLSEAQGGMRDFNATQSRTLNNDQLSLLENLLFKKGLI